MNSMLLFFVVMILIVLPFLVSCLYMIRKYGNRAPGGATLLWAVSLIIYYTLLFTVGGNWLDYKYPVQVHQEKVCEIKTTYTRQGLN